VRWRGDHEGVAHLRPVLGFLMAYEMRYCAYVDVLGFRNLIRELDAGKLDETAMTDLFYSMQEAPFEVPRHAQEADLKRQSISDAICISTTPTIHGFQWLALSLSALTANLLRRGYFVRGGLVKGKLSHSGEVVFGSALVRAYELESTVALYPRVMMTREVAADIQHYAKEDSQIGQYVRQAEDGPYYFHFLSVLDRIFAGPGDEGQRSVTAQHFNHWVAMIQQRFDESVDDPRHFEKVKWLAEYWNANSAPYRRYLGRVTGPSDRGIE
jgi:hypothetical protein